MVEYLDLLHELQNWPDRAKITAWDAQNGNEEFMRVKVRAGVDKYGQPIYDTVQSLIL